ncbi:MAG TPA: toll/interleukin-1 receptor domain-containing protein, partial [Plasticicumulans sp.]|nr:toll/interleukin-1 receptor domain-containing protein [Plasticicumulans sp.]
MPGKVFVSYSHKDEKWKDRVVEQLGVLGFDGLLEVWEDRQIAAGDDWKPAIQKAIAECDAALLLISASFLTSKFIRGEEVPPLLKRRQEEGIRVVPVILKPCPWTELDWLNPIQARPTDGKPLSKMRPANADEALSRLVSELSGLLKAGKPAGPFDGGGSATRALPPDPIDLTHLPDATPDFLGRIAELEALDAAWTDDAGTDALVLVAPGGTGKSSL